jgi:cyclophilin family peptidyl-prolyl cis-trans isomerase/HEAT repeat protein
MSLLLPLAPHPAGAAERRPAQPPSRIESLGRILELEDARSAGAGEIERLLGSADRGIRRRAALAAGRIADPALLPSLIGLMNDPEPHVRRVAAFALGLLGERSAVDRLIASLGDGDALVRARAAEALGRIGDPRAAPEIARFVLTHAPALASPVAIRGDDPAGAEGPWVELRLALFALALLKDVDAAATALMDGERPRFDWWASTWVAMRLESARLRPVLLAAAGAGEPYQRALAARGLGALKDPSPLAPLERLARDEEAAVVVEALRALAALGDPRGLRSVERQLASGRDVVRREALLALAALPPDRRLLATLVSIVGDPDPWIRSAALGALARADRETLALVLSGLDPDPDFRVRIALARALGTLGDANAIAILHGMLSDEDARVLPAVLEALRRARGRDSLDTLTRHLDHVDPGVRTAAAEGVAALGARGLGAALLGSWRRGLGASGLEARLAAVTALAAAGDEGSRAALLEIARADPVRVVRARASTALRDAGASQVPPPGPESALRLPLDYRMAMAPFDPVAGVEIFTPRAFLRTARGTIEIHLDVVEAPLASASFVDLVRRGFFEGLVFHRVEPGFVVQGGCPRGDGYGDPGDSLRCEITRRSYGRGSVGMALAGKDTGGSQFFITLAPQPHLDGRYTRFGTVVAGMDVVDRLRPGDRIEGAFVWTGE